MIALSLGRVRACAFAFALGACCAALSVACGGAQPEAKPASAPSEPHVRKKVPQREAEPESEAAEAPARSSCDDGGCFACGGGNCPSGWYCDEGASGGPACSWLPNCGSKGSCGCVTKTLGAGCTCAEEAGGLHVSCK